VRHSTRLAAALVAATLVGLLWAGFGGGHRDEQITGSAGLQALPASPAPALQIGRPKRLFSARYLSRWTVVRLPTLAHAQPNASSAVVAELATSAPEGTPNLLTALGARTGADGRVWVEARLPVLPNGTVGWVPRRRLGPYQAVNTRLVVDRERLQATLYRQGRLIFSAPVGVGTAAWPTPVGEFSVRSKLTRYASPFYGPVAFGTTARSAVLTDWPDGGFVGIHGTNEPQLLPGRVSHGCIRLRNPDILRLVALMPVGTPVTIR
jgi:lipoprotein-anchoring transpeptidase ErfK/SrfK